MPEKADGGFLSHVVWLLQAQFKRHVPECVRLGSWTGSHLPTSCEAAFFCLYLLPLFISLPAHFTFPLLWDSHLQTLLSHSQTAFSIFHLTCTHTFHSSGIWKHTLLGSPMGLGKPHFLRTALTTMITNICLWWEFPLSISRQQQNNWLPFIALTHYQSIPPIFIELCSGTSSCTTSWITLL